jgi:hypothetical protein
MIWRSATELGALLTVAVVLCVAASIDRSVSAQDNPEVTPEVPDELRDMPETLPAEPPQNAVPAGESSAPMTPPREESASEKPAPAGLRLEAQLLAAMSFPFGGKESGSAFGFGISYGAGWGTIPILIGLDFMSVGRSSSATLQLSSADDVVPTTVTRTSSDRLLDFDLWLRVQPPRWPVRPYAEGFVGAKLIRASWAIASHDKVTKTGSDSEWASALGWGVGVDFMGLFNAVAAFSLTLGMRRLHGSDVALERPSVSDGRVVVHKRQVATNETIFMAGLCGRYDFEAAE